MHLSLVEFVGQNCCLYSYEVEVLFSLGTPGGVNEFLILDNSFLLRNRILVK
jgi:hypothetical protein